MPRDPQSRSNGSRRGRQTGGRGSAGWLIVFLALAGLLAALILVPDAFRSLMDDSTPPELGEEPRQAADADAETAARERLEMPSDTVVDTESRHSRVTSPEKAELTAEPERERPTVSQERQGLELLDRAEEAYRSYQWDEARSLAQEIRDMDVSAPMKVRAQDILRGAEALEQVFSRLDSRHELSRNLETHPLLVTLSTDSGDEHVLPITDRHEREIVETDDPVAWIESQLASGSVTVMFTSGIPYQFSRNEVYDVRPADRQSVIQEKQQEFERRLERLKRSSLAKDPLAWYEAAKFAYRNRLDERVTEMLDHALELDPFLADSIKEDKAQEIFLKMVQNLDKGNRAAAAGWKRQLDQYYQDTNVYDQAVAYYQGNLEDLRRARKQALAQRREKEREARAERLKRAQALDDQEAVEEIRNEPEDPEAAPDLEASGDAVAERDDGGDDEPAAPAPSGDQATADQALEEGMQILAKAQNMGVSDERDRTYAKAQKFFEKAVALYSKLGMEAEMVKANQYRYACIKMRRF